MTRLATLCAAAGLLAGCGGASDRQSLYCYKTLAAVDCYSEPVLQDRRRLVGHVGAPPPPPLPAAQPLTVLPGPPDAVAGLWDPDQLSR